MYNIVSLCESHLRAFKFMERYNCQSERALTFFNEMYIISLFLSTRKCPFLGHLCVHKGSINNFFCAIIQCSMQTYNNLREHIYHKQNTERIIAVHQSWRAAFRLMTHIVYFLVKQQNEYHSDRAKMKRKQLERSYMEGREKCSYIKKKNFHFSLKLSSVLSS